VSSMLLKILIPLAIVRSISGVLVISGAVLGYQDRRTLGNLLVL
jgi:hypothetical protein